MKRERILLCLAHMSGREMEFIEEAFAQNWVVPMGPNVNGFEADLEAFVNRRDGAAPLHKSVVGHCQIKRKLHVDINFKAVHILVAEYKTELRRKTHHTAQLILERQTSVSRRIACDISHTRPEGLLSALMIVCSGTDKRRNSHSQKHTQKA